jgi:hypothetical protein
LAKGETITIGTRKPGPQRGRSRPGLDHDGQRIPSKYDAYLGTELIVRASATPLLAAARALVALTV